MIAHTIQRKKNEWETHGRKMEKQNGDEEIEGRRRKKRRTVKNGEAKRNNKQGEGAKSEGRRRRAFWEFRFARCSASPLGVNQVGYSWFQNTGAAEARWLPSLAPYQLRFKLRHQAHSVTTHLSYAAAL